MEEIQIVTKYTGELTKKNRQDYFYIFQNVFGQDKKIERKFEKKYDENIYGESLIVFCYIEDKCIAIQSFLRNDLDGHIAFESGDSATLSEYRGKGIFSSLVKKGIEALPEEAIIYGFPNENSLPAFRKMGWHIGEVKKTRLMCAGAKNSIENIENEYLIWMISGEKASSYYYTRRWGKYLILKKKKMNFYQIIGATDMELSSLEVSAEISIKKATIPLMFIHSETGWLGKGMRPITYRDDLYKVKLHKLDVYLTVSL